MSNPGNGKESGRGPPDLLSRPVDLPLKINTGLGNVSPQRVNSRKTRTPSPKKPRSVSPKNFDPKPPPTSVSTKTQSLGTSRPLTGNGNDRQGATSVGPPKPQRTERASHPSRTAPDTSTLDVYAPSYVPLWLRAVNESIAVPRFCSLLETIDFPIYINGFAGRQHLQPLGHVKLPPIQPVSVEISISPESLTPANYADYFREALQNEIFSEAAELRTRTIFAADFSLQDALRHLYHVKVPGLRENSPRIDIGDIILVRPLFNRPDAPEVTNAWLAPGGGKEMGYCAPGFSGLEFHAIVWGVARPKEEILLRVDGLTATKCNVIFAVQEHRSAPMARCITSTADFLRASRSALVTSDWSSRMLFPTTSDGVQQLSLSKGTFPNMKWIDTQLNYEQQKATYAVFNTSYGNVPYLVSGPPGTGKTKTIVEITLQLLRRPQNLIRSQCGAKQAPHILLCAPSDSAADTLASRLATQLTPVELFRLNGWSRSFPEVPGLLLPYSYVEKDLFSLPKFQTLMSYKVVVTTCRDADMLVQARLTNRALTHLTRSTLRAVAPGTYQAVSASQLLHWTALLIDEAAQATEPEALIPLTVIVPPIEAQTENQDLSSLPQFIMAGDEYQLGPRLHSSNSSALSTSLFARLFSRALYAKHPLARQMGLQRLTSSMLPMNWPPFTNLMRNYRSHPSILSVPSQLFYNDTLIPERAVLSEIIRTWSGWKSPHSWPVLFLQNTTPDTVESVLSGNGTGAGALSNHGEVMNALKLVQGLLEHRVPRYGVREQIKQIEIAVVSPFKTQVNLLRKVFREKGLYDVNIGPLEAFQGLESRILVLCTTRTRRGADQANTAKFVREDRQRGLGVIGESKRFNVAITRAKEGLIVLGDPETLTVEADPCWEAFISFCARNGCVMPESKGKGSELDWRAKFAKRDGVKEGRLERALVFAADVKIREASRKEQKGFGYPESPKTRQQKRFSLKGQMLTTDEEMWKTGLQMAEEMDQPSLLEDYDEDGNQGAGNVEDEDPDPWNSARYATGKKEALIGQTSRAETPTREALSLVPDPKKDSPSLTATTKEDARDETENRRVFSSASAEEFDRDPKAEFERTDCATQ